MTNSGTTLISDELTALPAVDATEHMAIVLDYLGAGNGPEIVWVTAHTAGVSTATIVRGREGTSGVEHTSIRPWIHTVTPADYINQVTAATRPSGTGLPFTGQIVFETDTGRLMRYDGTAWHVLGSNIRDEATVNSGGNITLAQSTTWANLDNNLDLSIAAAAGDIITFHLNLQFLLVAGSQVQIDVRMVTSGNYAGTAVETNSGGGIPGWCSHGFTGQDAIAVSYPYTVVSGDISSGVVAARLRVRVTDAAALAQTIYRTTDVPIRFWAVNNGPSV